MIESDASTVQSVQLAIGQIREAWAYLDDDARMRGRPRIRPWRLTPEAADLMDQLLREERADRPANARLGLAPSAASTSPANLSVLDAEQHTLSVLHDLVHLAASELYRRTPMLVWAPAEAPTIDMRLAYLATTAPLLGEQLARQAANQLTVVARLLRSALALVDVWTPIVARCPACQRPTLRAQFSSPNVRAWTVECAGADPACICTGQECPCQRPGRRPVSRHLWSATQIRRLGQIALPDVEPVKVETGVMTVDGDVYITLANSRRYIGVPYGTAYEWYARAKIASTRWNGQNWFRLTELQNVAARAKRRSDAVT